VVRDLVVMLQSAGSLKSSAGGEYAEHRGDLHLDPCLFGLQVVTIDSAKASLSFCSQTLDRKNQGASAVGTEYADLVWQ